MKLFQKAYPLLSVMLLSSGGIFWALDSMEKRGLSQGFTKAKVLSSINQAYGKVFPWGKNLFDRKNLSRRPWRKMLYDVRSYVMKNARSAY